MYYFQFFNPTLRYCQQQTWASVSVVLHSHGITSKAVWTVHMVPPSVHKWNWSSGTKANDMQGFGLYGKYIHKVFNGRTTTNFS